MSALAERVDLIPCMMSQLDIFEKQAVQTCITGVYEERLKPLAALQQTQAQVIEFYSAGRPLCFMDLNNLTLRLVVYMRKKTTKAGLGANDNKTSVINCPLHSFFSQCEISLAERPVTKNPSHYGYKVLFDINTSACRDAMETQLQCILYSPESRPDSAENCTAWGWRQHPFLRSQRVELVGRLRADVCQLHNNLLVLDNVALRVKLTMAEPDFFFWSTDDEPDIELVVEDCQLNVRYYQITPELSMGVERMLLSQNAVYRFKSTEIKNFVHPANTELILLPIAYSGKLPSTVFITVLKTSDFNGDIKSNPFYFPHSGLKEMALYCNGVQRKYEFNMTSKQMCATVLRSLYRELGYQDEDTTGHFYTMEALRDGNWACAFDLSVDSSGSGSAHNVDMHGTVRIEGRLTQPLPHSLCILLYAQYDSAIEISAARDVIVI